MWLTGDNVDNSVDSRTFGPVPCGLILGRVCYKVSLVHIISLNLSIVCWFWLHLRMVAEGAISFNPSILPARKVNILAFLLVSCVDC